VEARASTLNSIYPNPPRELPSRDGQVQDPLIMSRFRLGSNSADTSRPSDSPLERSFPATTASTSNVAMSAACEVTRG
jgi:hypothetical protein